MFSTRKRPFYVTAIPTKQLVQAEKIADFSNVPPTEPISFKHQTAPQFLVDAMATYQAVLDIIRNALINKKMGSTSI
tara:strand:+ start:128 stop:358 length:231 start_codon:yes stop_codon:yes gene_type:complete